MEDDNEYSTIDASTMHDQAYIYDINSNITISSSTFMDSPSKTIINTPLEVNGRDILAELDELREALVLICRDIDMEEKYPELTKIKEQYDAALAKYKTFDTIKESK